ncbi:hypothetical protein IscW_ISCW012566 [Ixodes scapularis]|uniref:Uncharacterized protein n=1 Tax=Ixodes scapularis TaxID=6945 RepID=B7QBX4_IXOSC|nr:hypothetical protein IscW_ISCW012566 [Ixodes scapularis]|eukprot:XP_002413038.1 hypothetical protein IscW_ISCW012566 [Ixodes scapularis]
MEVFTVEIQSILTGLTLNAAVLFMAYFVASHRCCHGPDSALASAHVATLSYAKCFAAGIFLGTLFVGFMPKARASVELALKSNRIHAAFPVAETLVLIGFCAALWPELGREQFASLHSRKDGVGTGFRSSVRTGTFFHVLFVEILPVEMGSLENRQPKVTSLIAGFALATATSFASNRTLVRHFLT